MNIKIKDIFILFLSILTILFILTNNSVSKESINYSINLWINNLFPILFPFIILTNILVEYDYSYMLRSKIFNKLFKLNNSCLYVYLCSLICGFPISALLISNLVDNKKIDKEEASRLITFTNYPSLIFIFGFINNSIILNNKVCVIISLSLIISGLITGIIFNYNKAFNSDDTSYHSNNNIFSILNKSIYKGFNSLFLLLGIICIVNVVTSMIFKFINLNLFIKTILLGFIEITTGISNINYLNTNLFIKTLLITFFLAFNGLSVHIQILSITIGKIKYKYYFYSRIIHSIISIILVSILFILLI